jgi:hypothetical protein
LSSICACVHFLSLLLALVLLESQREETSSHKSRKQSDNKQARPSHHIRCRRQQCKYFTFDFRSSISIPFLSLACLFLSHTHTPTHTHSHTHTRQLATSLPSPHIHIRTLYYIEYATSIHASHTSVASFSDLFLLFLIHSSF